MGARRDSGGAVLTVDIQPPNEIYGTFARLNYKPWYAIAEFVDNSTQSFFSHRRELAAAEGQALLDIDVIYDRTSNNLTISDTAYGMDATTLARGMRISTPPPDRTGRSEFGMGMKTAACWFGPRWTVDTTQLGDPTRYRLTFDIEELSKTGEARIAVKELREKPEHHGTTITIEDLRKPIVGRQIEKIRKLLTSMYRVDLDSGVVKLRWNGEPLLYDEPALWNEEREGGGIIELRQPIDAVVTDPATQTQHVVTGWLGILETMSSSQNGFALLRRGRVIIGGPDEGWRPTELVGSVGSHSWKRLVGQLHLDDFPVNFTKDGFAWDGGLEDELVNVLNPIVSTYRQKASSMRTRIKGGAAPADFVRVVEEVQKGVNEPSFQREIIQATTPLPTGLPPEPEVFEVTEGDRVPSVLEVPFPSGTLKATLFVRADGPHAPWLSIHPLRNDDVEIMLNTSHRFVASCIEDERTRVLVGKVALATALAEQQARNQHGDSIPAEEVRMLLHTILLHALS